MNIAQAQRILSRCVNKDVPFMMWGPPGVGKSSITHAEAEDRGWPVINRKISQIDPTSLAGVAVPRRNHIEKITDIVSEVDMPQYNDMIEQVEDVLEQRGSANVLDWYRPNWLPSRDDAPDSQGILFLDEINQAGRLQQAAAWELVFEKRLGQHYLPDGWRVVCAGNRAGDDAQTQRMASSLKNRLVHAEVEADVDIWTDWASGRIHPSIVGFINFKPSCLMADDLAGRRSFPSPRTWEYASILYDPDVPARERRDLVEGAVGEHAAAEFFQWENVYQDLRPEDILQGNVDPQGEDESFQYASVFSVIEYLNRTRKTEQVRRNAAQFVQSLDREYQMVLTRVVSEDNDLWNSLSQEEEFQDLANELVELAA